MKFCPGSIYTAMECYDALMELEKIGLPIRDYNDEFKGAAFRDDKSKLMFAYDYERRNLHPSARWNSNETAVKSRVRTVGRAAIPICAW